MQKKNKKKLTNDPVEDSEIKLNKPFRYQLLKVV